MFTHHSSQFQREVVIIHPGEYLATSKDLVISTVLGSCIAVALFDTREKRGGLNHFMLPGTVREEDHFASPNAKYGLHAMELLINDLLKSGVRKEFLVAKVFGGGSVLGSNAGYINKIPQSNIDFVFSFLKAENIPVMGSDTGGLTGRKIFFFVRENRVLLKRITGSLIKAIDVQEQDYLENIKKQPESGEVMLF